MEEICGAEDETDLLFEHLTTAFSAANTNHLIRAVCKAK